MCDANKAIVGLGTGRKLNSMRVRVWHIARCFRVIRFFLLIQQSSRRIPVSASVYEGSSSNSLSERRLFFNRRLQNINTKAPNVQQSTPGNHGTSPPSRLPSAITNAPFLPASTMPSSAQFPTQPSATTIFFPTTLSIKAPMQSLMSVSPTLKSALITTSPTSESLSLNLSDFPSISPSHSPSSSSSASLATSSSDSPSLSPSHKPPSLSTSLPNMRSDYPSLSPSYRPSVVNNLSPASDFRLNYPSDWPSISPSIVPSVLQPSDLPSISPSLLPSTIPSNAPSIHPTSHPSRFPTLYPTSAPSFLPSDTPSVAPTQFCHDDPSYASPINNLTCGDFRGTQCTQWRFVGLTIDELQDLITSCPKSCNVTCRASFAQFRARIAYHITNMPGLMSFDSVSTLQQVSISFLTNYVQSKLPPSDTFVLTKVELSSQAILKSAGSSRNLRRKHSRYLQGVSNVTLDVSVIFSGFAIGLTNDEITEHLVSGIDDPGYTKSIQRSGDPFLEEAEASSAIQTGPPNAPIEAGNKKGGPSGSTVAAVTVAALVGVAAFGIGAYIHRSRSGHWIPASFRPSDHSKPTNRFTSCSPGSYDDVNFPHGELANLSFSSGRALLRVITSNSKDSTSSSSGSNQSQSEEVETGTLPLATANEVEEREEERSKAHEEHPLDGIFPPLVVFDNIDDQDDENIYNLVNNTTRQRGEGLGVPIRHVAASTGLLAALNDNDKPLTPTSLAKMMYKEAPGLYRPSIEITHLQLEAMDSPTSTEVCSSEAGDDASIATPPPAQQKTIIPSTMRRSKSSSAFEQLATASHVTGSLHTLRKSTSDLGVSLKLDNDNPDGYHDVWCDDDQPPDTSQKPLDQVPLLQDIAGFHHRKQYHSDTLAETSLTEARTVRRGNERESRRSFPSLATETMLRHSLWSLNPMRKQAIDPPPKTTDLETVNTCSHTSLDNNKDLRNDSKEGFEFSVAPEEWPVSPLLSGSQPDNSGDELSSSEDLQPGLRYEVNAPRNKKLGLIIESAQNEGPIVHEVKKQSPLFGLVYPGDKIISIDETDTSKMSLFAVTRLLGEKRQRRGDKLMKITVFRPQKQEDDQDIALEMTQTRDDSIDSYADGDPFLQSEYDDGGSILTYDQFDSLEELLAVDVSEEEQQPNQTVSDQLDPYNYSFLQIGIDFPISRPSDDGSDTMEDDPQSPHDIYSDYPPFTGLEFELDNSGKTTFDPTQSMTSAELTGNLMVVEPNQHYFPRIGASQEPTKRLTSQESTQILSSLEQSKSVAASGMEDGVVSGDSHPRLARVTASNESAMQVDAISAIHYPPYPRGLETNESMVSYGTTGDSEASPMKEQGEFSQDFLAFQLFGTDHKIPAPLDNARPAQG